MVKAEKTGAYCDHPLECSSSSFSIVVWKAGVFAGQFLVDTRSKQKMHIGSRKLWRRSKEEEGGTFAN